MVFTSHSEAETREIAARWAKQAAGGLAVLRGEMGAGKTAFVKGAAQALGCPEVPTSPTFTLLHIYEGGRLPLYHFDLYRLQPGDAERLGFYEYFENPALLCLVEWAERADLRPNVRISIFPGNGDTERLIEIIPWEGP